MLANPTFWTGVAFVLFFAVLGYYGVHRSAAAALDKRSGRIADELAEAQRLRAEAQALLAEFEQKRKAAEQEAAAIVTAAREEAERLAVDAQARVADFVTRRTAAAETKIAQAEAQAMAEVRAAAADAAVRASEHVLRDQLSGGAGEELLSRSVSEVRTRLS
jgi:F-type H+-transporting ATPase subunit b